MHLLSDITDTPSRKAPPPTHPPLPPPPPSQGEDDSLFPAKLACMRPYPKCGIFTSHKDKEWRDGLPAATFETLRTHTQKYTVFNI